MILNRPIWTRVGRMAFLLYCPISYKHLKQSSGRSKFPKHAGNASGWSAIRVWWRFYKDIGIRGTKSRRREKTIAKAISDLLCKIGNHDWRDGPGMPCVKCGATDELFRTECQEYINCDICHQYVPTQYCNLCAIDWCAKCHITHDEIHIEALERGD